MFVAITVLITTIGANVDFTGFGAALVACRFRPVKPYQPDDNDYACQNKPHRRPPPIKICNKKLGRQNILLLLVAATTNSLGLDH